MHEAKSFYKYVSAEVGRIILMTKALRWSSPVLFDDPYDVTRELARGISPSEIQKCTIDEIERMVKANEKISSDFNDSTKLLWAMFKMAHEKNMLDETLAELRNSANELTPNGSSLIELRDMWQKLMPTFRILCLSARHDIELMWKIYADEHRGVVLEFNCLKDFDPPWRIAEPVLYEDRPSLLSNTGWGKLLTLNQDNGTRFIFNESCHTKTTTWAYQEEWRIVSFTRPDETGYFSDYKFYPQNLSGIYLGTKISTDNRDKILSLLKNEFSHVNLHYGQEKNGALQFNAISVVGK